MFGRMSPRLLTEPLALLRMPTGGMEYKPVPGKTSALASQNLKSQPYGYNESPPHQHQLSQAFSYTMQTAHLTEAFSPNWVLAISHSCSPPFPLPGRRATSGAFVGSPDFPCHAIQGKAIWIDKYFKDSKSTSFVERA